MRQIVLDTETTGLEPEQGHRVIEIGCVELIDRRATGRNFHRYLNPQREIDAGALEVHGLTAEFLADKPRFAEVVDELLAFVGDAELVIHNAEFDLGFLNNELRLQGNALADLRQHCHVLDTLLLARQLHPGQRNSLDALCRRYAVDNSQRDLHGALLDAQILAEVYLAMTGGQADLSLGELESAERAPGESAPRFARGALQLVVSAPSAEELAAHAAMLAFLEQQGGVRPLWQAVDVPVRHAAVGGE
jgi:DNA polymerase-3 subunit epsilon